MVTAIPFVIFFGSVATAALLFYALWDTIQGRGLGIVRNLSTSFDRAGMRRRPDDWVMTWAAATVVLWMIFVLLMRPPVVVGLIVLPICGVLCAFGAIFALRIRVARRLDKFTQQLELALRLMGSALRVGLGLRQAIAMAVDEMPEPSKSEYARVIAQTNIGISIHDALDDLAERMPSNETRMMARVIRIQSQTGGDLSKVLEQLANTIKERRRMRRKVSTMTAEGRASAIVLVVIPIAIGIVVAAIQPPMRHALLDTMIGHITMVVVVVLELLSILTLRKILKVNFA